MKCVTISISNKSYSGDIENVEDDKVTLLIEKVKNICIYSIENLNIF